MTTSDDRLVADLRAMWRLADPAPAGLSDAMVAVVAAVDLDDELEMLVLVRDSADEPAAQVRGLGTARMLYFRAVQGWALEVEIDDHQVRGQLLDHEGDVSEVRVWLDALSGDRWACELDEFGFFNVEARVDGSVRFIVGEPTTTTSSRWFQM